MFWDSILWKDSTKLELQHSPSTRNDGSYVRPVDLFGFSARGVQKFGSEHASPIIQDGEERIQAIRR